MSNRSARKSNYIFEYRITVLGSSCVGKTSLIKRLTNDEFTERHTATTEDHFQHVIDHNGSTCVCLLIDTSGSFEFPAMKKWSISKANAFIVVYSVTDKKSFKLAKLLVDEIKEVKGAGVEIKIMLIANKTDSSDDNRRISKKEGRDYAKAVSHDEVTCDFVETSAKSDSNVTEALHGLLNMFLPEQLSESQAELSTEKRSNSLTRSLTRKKKNSKTRKDSAFRQELLRGSDEFLDRECPGVQRQRAYSLDTDQYGGSSSDSSDNSLPSPELPTRDVQTEGICLSELQDGRRQSGAKELIRRTTSACRAKLDRAKKKLKSAQKINSGTKRRPSIEIYRT
eukprot:gene13993-15451_t